jgi:hypothetical protein
MTERFTLLAESVAREGHKALQMNNGAVFIARGKGQDDAPLASTEVYSQ